MNPIRRPLAPAPRPRGALALLLCGALLLAGCAVPQEARRSLAGYTQAMGQVEQSAGMFLLDFAHGLRAQEELKRGPGAAPAAREYPSEFLLPGDPDAPQDENEKAQAATRQALLVIRAYNQALVALAEGRPESDVREQAGEFGGALQSLASVAGQSLPGLGAATALGARLVKLVQDGASRQQLQQAVQEGREPVGAILAVLEQQAPAMYRLSVVRTSQEQDRLKDDLRRAAAALKTLLARHGAPADAELAGALPGLQAQLAEIGRRTRTLAAMPLPFAFAAGRPAYDAAAHAEAQVLGQFMGTSAQKYAELVARQNAGHALMNKYVLALRQTRASLDLVADSLARPVDLRAEAARLAQVAAELRGALADYHHPPQALAAP